MELSQDNSKEIQSLVSDLPQYEPTNMLSSNYVAKSQLTLEFPRILDRFLCTCLPFSVIVHTTPGQQSIMR